MTYYPRLGLVQKTLEFPEFVSAKFNSIGDDSQSGRWALIVLINTLKTLGYEKEVEEIESNIVNHGSEFQH